MNLDPHPPEVPEVDRALLPPADDITGLPALRTWRRVYLFVFLVFVVYVVLLTILSRVFA